MHTNPYEGTHANPPISTFEDWTGKSSIQTKSLYTPNRYESTHADPPMSIFKDWAGKYSTKSPQAPRCRRKRRLPLKSTTT